MGDKNVKTDSSFTFEFPIVVTWDEAPMKNIPLSSLPSFQGMAVEDPDTFMFEFYVLCRGYDYTSDAQKLKLLHATLKGEALIWFMRLGVGKIRTWNDMREAFLFKYQDYFRTRDLKDKIFKIAQKEEENLEDYLERFH